MSQLYNLEHVEDDRIWLKDVLLTMDHLDEDKDLDTVSDPQTVTEKDLKLMMRQEKRSKKYRKKYKRAPTKVCVFFNLSTNSLKFSRFSFFSINSISILGQVYYPKLICIRKIKRNVTYH